MLMTVDQGSKFDEGLRLLAIMEALQEAWEGMPVSVASLFIVIAQHDSRKDALSITEAGERVGMKLASTSRNIQLLENKMGERGSKPVALVEIKAHPSDYRRKVVQLTPKGRALYERLCNLVRA
ncbi:MarR family winged helix-turn-helix transcriptional regulator [Phyllobacterium endophyticum]|uniref:MarR family winged helix-turn-helix transcriptional regulator n=1 Tax=Phyllobacterium endophyticum TaxID=1149773 RepID=UPI0011CACC5A|nr:hypothetical protein [Phyllobacterium endophyticum]TXR49876.1 hypothetical protein FVA77_07635 [Phyllobacterium endophyticum]